jgi:hypothetical protein
LQGENLFLQDAQDHNIYGPASDEHCGRGFETRGQKEGKLAYSLIGEKSVYRLERFI